MASPTRRLDRLFGQRPGPRQDRARRLLWVALPLNLLGLVSCASVVGVFFTLAAWQITREDLERVERGELDPDAAPGISRLHDLATAGLLWCVLTFVLQIVLLQSGVVARVLGG